MWCSAQASFNSSASTSTGASRSRRRRVFVPSSLDSISHTPKPARIAPVQQASLSPSLTLAHPRLKPATAMAAKQVDELHVVEHHQEYCEAGRPIIAAGCKLRCYPSGPTALVSAAKVACSAWCNCFGRTAARSRSRSSRHRRHRP